MSFTDCPKTTVPVGFRFFLPLAHSLCLAHLHALDKELFKEKGETPVDWSRNLDWIRRLWLFVKDYEKKVAPGVLPGQVQMDIDAVAATLDGASVALGLDRIASVRMDLLQNRIRKAVKLLESLRRALNANGPVEEAGLEAVKEALQHEFEMLGKSVTRNREFLEGRIAHAIGVLNIAQGDVQHFVCMDLRLLFFLSLIEAAIAASEGPRIYQKCGLRHSEAMKKVTNKELLASISHRKKLCDKLAHGELPEDLFTFQEKVGVA